MEKTLLELLSVARLFLQKRATIGELRKAVREKEGAGQGRQAKQAVNVDIYSLYKRL